MDGGRRELHPKCPWLESIHSIQKWKNREVSRIGILFINTEKKWLKEWKIIASGE